MSTKVYEAYRVREGHDPYAVLWKIQRRGQAGVRRKLTKLFEDVIDGLSHAEHLKNEEQNRLFKDWLKAKYPDRDDFVKDFPILRTYSEWAESECPAELKRVAGVYAVSNEEVFEKARREKKVGSDETPSVLDVDGWALVKYGEQLTKYQKDWWALDVSVTVRVLDGRYYLIPYCERSSLVGGVLEFMRKTKELEDYSFWDNVDPPEEVPPEEWEARGKTWNHFTDVKRWRNYLALEIVSFGGWHEISPMMNIARKRGKV